MQLGWEERAWRFGGYEVASALNCLRRKTTAFRMLGSECCVTLGELATGLELSLLAGNLGLVFLSVKLVASGRCGRKFRGLGRQGAGPVETCCHSALAEPRASAKEGMCGLSEGT